MSLPSTLVDRKTGRAARVSESGQLAVSAFGGSGPVPLYRTRHLRDAAGSIDAAIDGSAATGTPTEFFAGPPSGEIWRVTRLLVFIQDTKIIAQQYGNQGILPVGVKLYVANDDVDLIDLLDGETVTVSAKWAAYCFDAQVMAWGAGDEFLTVRWTFTKAGVPIRLIGNKRERIAVYIADNLSGLASHEFIIQGYREGEVHV